MDRVTVSAMAPPWLTTGMHCRGHSMRVRVMVGVKEWDYRTAIVVLGEIRSAVAPQTNL